MNSQSSDYDAIKTVIRSVDTDIVDSIAISLFESDEISFEQLVSIVGKETAVEQTQQKSISTNGDDDDTPDDSVPDKASKTVKTINDNEYLYWQWRDGDSIKSKYIGPNTN